MAQKESPYSVAPLKNSFFYRSKKTSSIVLMSRDRDLPAEITHSVPHSSVPTEQV